MLKRLGLVIHWLGFIVSVVVLGITVIEIAIEISYGPRTHIEDYYGYAPIIYGKFGNNAWYAAIVYGPLGIAWVIRFILTGHKGLMPWSKAKQP